MDDQRFDGKGGGMIYERQSVRWVVATVLLTAALTGIAYSAFHAWRDSDWSYVLLGALCLCGAYPFIRELRLLKK